MTTQIKQSIKKLGDATYEVTLNVDGEEYSEVFERSNAVFPAYKSLTKALYEFDGVAIDVITDSEAVVREFNTVENSNSTLLNSLKNVIARNALVVTISNE